MSPNSAPSTHFSPRRASTGDTEQYHEYRDLRRPPRLERARRVAHAHPAAYLLALHRPRRICTAAPPLWSCAVSTFCVKCLGASVRPHFTSWTLKSTWRGDYSHQFGRGRRRSRVGIIPVRLQRVGAPSGLPESPAASSEPLKYKQSRNSSTTDLEPPRSEPPTAGLQAASSR